MPKTSSRKLSENRLFAILPKTTTEVTLQSLASSIRPMSLRAAVSDSQSGYVQNVRTLRTSGFLLASISQVAV